MTPAQPDCTADLKVQTTFLVHKPLGYVCSKVDSAVTDIIREKGHERVGEKRGGDARPTMYDLAIACGFPGNFSLVGRLDADTSGLILFTSNKALMAALNYPLRADSINHNALLPFKQKEYFVKCLAGKTIMSRWREEGYEFNPFDLEKAMSEPFSFTRNGTTIDVSGAAVKVVERFQDPQFTHGRPDLGIGWCVTIKVTIAEGKHHQIRRLVKRNDFHVVSLIRIGIASVLTIESLPDPGSCRWLTEGEEETLVAGLLLSQASITSLSH